MPLAFAALCELIARAPTLRRALLIGWLFGLGQFAIGLNWIATAFTFQAAMPAWLGWVAVVLLSLYLAIYPMLAAGLAWRFGSATAARVGAGAGRRVGDHRMAARDDVHRLRVEPGRRDPGRYAAARGQPLDRHLRPLRCWSCLPAAHCGWRARQAFRPAAWRSRRSSPVAGSFRRARASQPTGCRQRADPHRPAQHRPGGQMARRLRRRSPLAAP